MSDFPNSLDDDITLPRVDDNITEIGAEAINALRDAVFNIEAELGLGASGTAGSVFARLAVSIEPDGTIKSSALTSLGLVTLPITNSQISASAQIEESKLDLDHSTADLYNTLVTQGSALDNILTFIQSSGSKLEPHISGASYNHVLSHIDIALSSNDFFKNRNGVLRNNTNLFTLLTDINTDLVTHEKANATSAGEIPPANYGHVAAGIYVNTSNFSFVPQTATDLQQFAQFIDNSNIFILGTRIQTFYSNGIARTARASTLTNSERGQSIVPSTPVITYFLNGGASTPVDNIDNGDDIIEFTPAAASISNSSFDAKFSAIKIGDVITVNYGAIEVVNIIKEKKLIVSGSDKRYVVRINRRNVAAGTFSAKVDKPLFNNNKYGVLALAQANAPTNVLPSLIAGNPRGAQILGLDFNPDQLDINHYNLWLVLYPTGNPAEGLVNLAPVDVTGNKGTTPGKYTLDSIVEATNNTFRHAGYNYRFIAFSYKGEFGIMLADPYGNAGFSVLAGILSTTGLYDNGLSNTVYLNNVIGTPGFDSNDALGFGPSKGNLASPPYSATFVNTNTAQTPTKLFIPLARNNYYVNGVERERFNLEPGQILDGYGDGYWNATITTKTIIPGARVEVTYQVDDDLSDVRWKPGQTLVVQRGVSGSVIDFGRFFIKDIQFNNCPGPSAYTNIVVYDAVHTTGSSPYLSAAVGTKVQLYFTSDSIGFNTENSSDFTVISSPFKRMFEIYINQDGYTFSHERGRLDISGSNQTINGVTFFGDSNLTGLNIYKISPKLRGYAFNSVTKINLQISSFDQTTGIYDGYLCKFDGTNITNRGPDTIGKKGEVVRFYDETNVDYIDFIFDLSSSIPQITSNKHLDIQLFPTLSLDEEVMLLGTCQVNDSTKKVQYLRDSRQFGNISEEQLSTSALDFIAAPTQLLHENGVIKGLGVSDIGDGYSVFTGDGYNLIHLNGGTAVVNGKVLNVNDEYVALPIVREVLYPAFSTTISTVKWFVCLNDKGKYEVVASTDFDPNGSFASSYNALSLTHTRLFYVKNPNHATSTAYAIKGTYFSDLILNHRDLMPVAVVTAPIILSGVTYIVDVDNATVTDARRFVSEGRVGMNTPFTLGAHSNFRTIEAMNTWLTELNNFKSAAVNLVNKIGDRVVVQDSIDISGSTFDFGNKITFVGDGGRFVVTSSATLIEIGLENLRVDITSNPGLIFSGTKNTINNCFINYAGITGVSIYPIRVNTSSRVVAIGNVFKKNGVDIGAYINNLGSLNVVVVGNVYENDTLVNGTSTSSGNINDG